MKKAEEIKELKKKVYELREQNGKLHEICIRQRDSLAAQQEAIVQLNISLDSTLACLTNIYGEQATLEDGTQARRVKIPTEDYPCVLDRFNVSAVMFEGQYVITVTPKLQEAENGQV